MLYPYIKKQYESLTREKQGLKRGDPTLLISNAVPDALANLECPPKNKITQVNDTYLQSTTIHFFSPSDDSFPS